MPEFEQYIRNVAKIWELDRPQSTREEAGENVYQRFHSQYRTIRTLAGENKSFVRSVMMPYFRGEKTVEAEDAAFLEQVCTSLYSLQELENYDRILGLKCRRLLLAYYRKTGNRTAQFRQLQLLILACYYTAFSLNRCCPLEPDDLFFRYNDEGIRYVEELESWLAPERFRELTEEEKLLTVVSVGYATLFQRGASYSPENLRYKVEKAEKALEMARDPAYRQQVPGLNWDQMEHHCLYYLAMCSDYVNWSGSEPELLQKIRAAGAELIRRHAQGNDLPGVEYDMVERAWEVVRMHLGEIPPESYLQSLLREYENRDPEGYSNEDVTRNLLIPGKIQDEVIRRNTYEQIPVSPVLGPIYRQVAAYTGRAPHDLAQEQLLNYLQGLMSDFQDVEGGPGFAEMARIILMNCSVPTSIHSRMVGKLAVILAKELIAVHPEELTGVCGCGSGEEVRSREAEILEFVNLCGMYHDLGKLAYLDIVGITYRDFFDEEFDAIKRHPLVGGEMLGKHADTAPFAMAAMGHHRWYNEQGGYPREYSRAKDPYPVVTDLIAVADCLDAATDTIFRSYNPGITLEKFISEVEAGAGTRYTPLGAELLASESVRQALAQALAGGREQAYSHMWEDSLTEK